MAGPRLLTGPTHDLARSPAFGSSGVSFQIPGSLSPSLKILGIITKKQTYKRALQRRYLERTCVHACIQLCTRGYTVVYTRVYSSLLGWRYSLGISSLGHRYFYLRHILLHDLASLITLCDFMRQPCVSLAMWPPSSTQTKEDRVDRWGRT